MPFSSLTHKSDLLLRKIETKWKKKGLSIDSFIEFAILFVAQRPILSSSERWHFSFEKQLLGADSNKHQAV